MAERYRVAEVFSSVQGEGVLAGVPMVFVRFAGCNMECDDEPGPRSPGGFKCDTEFASGRWVGLEELHEWIGEEYGAGYPISLHDPRANREDEASWLLLTGGEPALQVDAEFCAHFRGAGFSLAIETNGSRLLPWGGGEPPEAMDDALHATTLNRRDLLDQVLALFPFDHVTVSPKVAEHALEQRWAHELRYVRGYGQAIPRTRVLAHHRLVSPAFLGERPDLRAIQWCVRLVKANTSWRVSLQAHKAWGVR